MEQIKVFIINRNLVTTLKNTVEFLLKEPRVDIVIYDQCSDYPPLIEYYSSLGDNDRVTFVIASSNDGPYNVWGPDVKHLRNSSPYIVTDSDCIYDGIPDDWLDVMLEALQHHPKVGFSLEITDLPLTNFGDEVFEWEMKYWMSRTPYGWEASIDTTFALLTPQTEFTYKAIRLDRPYTMRHEPWYLTPGDLNEEWEYYMNSANKNSIWMNRLKNDSKQV